MAFDSSKKTLEVWLSSHLYTKQEDEAPLRKFRVSHHAEGSTKTNLITEAFVREGSEPSTLAEQILANCQSDADATGGVHRYVVKAMYGVKMEEPRGGRHIIKVRGKSDKDDDDTLDGIEVGPRGVLSMVMRHQEATIKYALSAGAEVMQQQTRMIELQQERIERTEERNVQLFGLLENAASARMERELAARQQVRKEMREDMVMNLAVKYVPALMAEKAPDSAFAHMAESFTDEQLEAIASHMTPDQLKSFVPIMRAILNKETSVDARRKQIAEKTAEVVDAAEGKSKQDIKVEEKGKGK